MAIRWVEGFNSADHATVRARVYDNVTGGPGTSAGAYDGSNGSVGAWSDDDLVIRTKSLVGTAQNTWVIGFAFRPTSNSISIGSNQGCGVRLRNSDGEQFRLEFTQYTPANSKPGPPLYRARVLRGATELAVSDQVFAQGSAAEAWIYFEFKVTIDNTTGSFDLRYKRRDKSGGFSTATWSAANTNVDTQNQTSTGADRIEISWEAATNSNIAYDDIYALDTTGAAPDNDYLNGVIVEPLTITGDGNSTDWALVDAASLDAAWDDGPTGVDDSDRATSDTTNDVSLVNLTALNNIQDDIVCVRLDHGARLESATGSLTLHFRYRKTTATPAEADGGSYTVDSTSNQTFTDIQRTDPNTASAWVPADVDAMEVGVRNGG